MIKVVRGNSNTCKLVEMIMYDCLSVGKVYL